MYNIKILKLFSSASGVKGKFLIVTISLVRLHLTLFLFCQKIYFYLSDDGVSHKPKHVLEIKLINLCCNLQRMLPFCCSYITIWRHRSRNQAIFMRVLTFYQYQLGDVILSVLWQMVLIFWRSNYFFLILAHPVYKMWTIQEPNMLELWNKLHFEEKKRRVYTMLKIFSTYICWINI